MLDFLRRNKDSFAVKILLGAMALMFIIFYGSETLRRSNNQGQHFMSSPASVNGVSLNGQKANFIIDAQMDNLRKQFKGEVPENFTQMIRQNVVNSLINSELAGQEAKRLGFGTSADELKEHIRTNPQFQENGQFNKDFYLEKFRPWYQMTRGTSYENDARDELAVQKISDAFAAILAPSDVAIARQIALDGNKYAFSIIKIRTATDSGDVLPKDLQPEKSAEQTGKDAQKQLADKVFAAWRSGENLDDLLKDAKLKIKDTGDLSASRLLSVFDGKEDVDALKKLLALTEQNPFPETYFDEGTYFYLVKRNASTSVAAKPSADELEAFKATYKDTLSSAIESAWIAALKSKGKISTNF